MTLARTIGHDALRINEETGNRYTMGLTLSTLSTIALLRGSYAKAIEYGQESLDIFQELEDTHGSLLAYLDLAKARRRWSKHELEKGRATKMPEIEQQLLTAQTIMEKALELAESAQMESHLVNLYAEQGRLFRDLGRVRARQEGLEAALSTYHKGVRAFRRALGSGKMGGADRAELLEDLGEIQFLSGDTEGAQACIDEGITLIPDTYRIEGERKTGEPTEHEYYAALAKLEMLRGQMAFMERKNPEEGLYHYLRANIYFTRFSPMATGRDRLIEYVYQRLRRLSLEEQRDLLSSAERWLKERDLKTEAFSFLKTLHALLGV
jgi:tetratricopeptide (TPR) repeat protein